MQNRAIRFTVLALLLVVGAGAGLVAANVAAQVESLEADRDEVAAQLEGVLTAINDIGTAQHTYVAPGQPAAAAFAQVATLIQRVHDNVQTVRPRLQSVEAAELLTMITAGAETLVEVDGSARNHYRNGQTLWASEIVFGQASETLATMTQAVRGLIAAESKAQASLRADLQRSLWMVLGGSAAVWVIGLLALTWLPSGAAGLDAAYANPNPAAEWTPPVSAIESADLAPAAAVETPAVDLAGTAAICAGISQITSTAAFPDLLARAATVLDATGIIIWMGAGDALFAAAAHGYDQRMLAHVGSIPRSAENATALAWRTGEAGIVASDIMSNGAIVAPMFGPHGSIGVLAVEVRQGREADAATRAVTAILAAQLSTVVAAWPATSTSATPAEVLPADTEAPPLREAVG